MSYLSCNDRITGTKRPAVDLDEEEMPGLKNPTKPPKKAVSRKELVVTIDEYQIFSDEMANLRNGVEINATIVYAMATLIRQKMKNDVCGFVDQEELSKPSYGGMFSGDNEGKTGIQIHYNGQGHFLTSSFNQSDEVVRLWDSLAQPVSQNLKLQLFSLYGSGKDSIQYTYESVRKQSNLVNCGVHAIVFAHDLAVDGGVRSFYVGKELRIWTEVCLMRREISILQRRPEHSARRGSILVGETITKQWFDQNSDRIEGYSELFAGFQARADQNY